MMLRSSFDPCADRSSESGEEFRDETPAKWRKHLHWLSFKLSADGETMKIITVFDGSSRAHFYLFYIRTQYINLSIARTCDIHVVLGQVKTEETYSHWAQRHRVYSTYRDTRPR